MWFYQLASLNASKQTQTVQTREDCACEVMEDKDKDLTNFASSSNVDEEEQQFISQEHGNLAQTIQDQLRMCKEEHDILRSKLKEVIEENNSLAELLNNEQSFKSYTNSMVTVNKNIQEQLDLAIQEKDSAVELWQTALQLISVLEHELKDYRDNTHLTSALEKINEVRGEYSRAICLLEEKLAAAKSNLGKEKVTKEFVEEQLKQSQNSYKLLEECYEKRSADVNEALAGQQAAMMKLNELEKRYNKLEEEAKEATLSCSELEQALEQSVSRLEKALTQRDEAQEKVSEALQIVDAAMIERDNAVSRAAVAKEETSRVQKAIAELISEAGSQVQAEAQQIKEEYNIRIKTVLVDMKRLREENKNKSTQIQKLKADLNCMENEVHRTKKELEMALRDHVTITALDRKVEGLFRAQEIVGSDAVRTDMELDQLRAEIMKVNQSRELEQQQFALERHLLEEQVKALQLELENASLTVADVSARADVLTVTLKQKEHQLNVLRQAFASSLSQYNSEKRGGETKLQVAEHIHRVEEGSRMHFELQNQLDSQRKLAQKWKSEVNDITLSFQSRLRELRSDVNVLQQENQELRNYVKAADGHLKKSRNNVQSNIGDIGSW